MLEQSKSVLGSMNRETNLETEASSGGHSGVALPAPTSIPSNAPTQIVSPTLSESDTEDDKAFSIDIFAKEMAYLEERAATASVGSSCKQHNNQEDGREQQMRIASKADVSTRASSKSSCLSTNKSSNAAALAAATGILQTPRSFTETSASSGFELPNLSAEQEEINNSAAERAFRRLLSMGSANNAPCIPCVAAPKANATVENSMSSTVTRTRQRLGSINAFLTATSSTKELEDVNEHMLKVNGVTNPM